MLPFLRGSKVLPLAGAILAFTLGAASPACAQDAPVVKAWPKHGAWQTTLVHRPQGGYLCMLNALGRDPHAFGVSFIEMPDHLLFMLDDRRSTERYLPTMTVFIDGREAETFATFNDPPMTSTEPGDAMKVKALIERLAQGKSLSVDARRARYEVGLDGFADAAGQFAACRLAAARLRQDTTGRGE
jgi:hypothetical protein